MRVKCSQRDSIYQEKPQTVWFVVFLCGGMGLNLHDGVQNCENYIHMFPFESDFSVIALIKSRIVNISGMPVQQKHKYKTPLML